jgi:two-component system response regulator VicR
MKNKNKAIVIEDDKDIANLLKYNLEKIGVESFLAYDGEEGLRLVKENMPDLIILDLMLPKIDGYAVLSAIKDNIFLSDVPVIILSAKVNPGAIVKGFRMGAVDYIPKPFNVGEFVLRVRELLERTNGATL